MVQMSGEVRTARLVLTPWLCGKSMAVREIEGDQTYDGQQELFTVAARIVLRLVFQKGLFRAAVSNLLTSGPIT